MLSLSGWPELEKYYASLLLLLGWPKLEKAPTMYFFVTISLPIHNRPWIHIMFCHRSFYIVLKILERLPGLFFTEKCLWFLGASVECMVPKKCSKNLQYSDAPVSQTCTFTMGPGSGCGAQYSTSTAVHCWSSSNPPLDQDVKTLPEMGNSLRLPQPPSPPLPSQVPCVPDCGQRTAQLLHLQMTEQNGATGDVEDISQKMEKFPLIPDGSVK